MQRTNELNKKICLIVFVMMLSVLVRLDAFVKGNEDPYLEIVSFYSCDTIGNPQYYFPVETTAYFNVTIRNPAIEPKNVSIYIGVIDECNVPVGLDELNVTIPSNASSYYIMDVFIPEWAFVGNATAQLFIFKEETPIGSETIDFFIDLEDKMPPITYILSPQNLTYTASSVPLTFTVNERTSVPWIAYCLNGLENITITGNTTLTSLPNGSYSLIVYANDTSNNTGSSNKVYFTVSVVHDVAIVDMAFSPTEVYIGQIINLVIVVRNEGTTPETFSVTTYYNSNVVNCEMIDNLAAGDQTILTFNWNTTDIPPGNYTMGAKAVPVPGEIDLGDNILTDGVAKLKSPPDIAVMDIATSKTVVGQGSCTKITATVENQGHSTETFNLTAYANTTIIQTKTVTLASGNSTIFTFRWNTTGIAKGNYTITVFAIPVLGETDTIDNALTNGWIIVAMIGDIIGPNGYPDGKCDIRDIGVIASLLDINYPHPLYNPNYDIYPFICDGKIDIGDIAIAAINFGKNNP